MEKSKITINVEGGFLFCGGWNFFKSVSVGSTFIREMRVLFYFNFLSISLLDLKSLLSHPLPKPSITWTAVFTKVARDQKEECTI